MKIMMSMAFALSATMVLAVPSVSQISLGQDPDSGLVTVSYRLSGEPAVVTVAFSTNGVALPAERYASVFGAVNRVVTNLDETVEIKWWPMRDWPDVKLTGVPLTADVTVWSTNAPPDYMVVDPALKGQARFYASAEAVPLGVSNEIYKTEKYLMRRIHAANVRWRMGSPANESNRETKETLHSVTLTEDYFMSVYPVTQAQWRFLGRAIQEWSEKPAFTNRADSAIRPVNDVNYEEMRGSDKGSKWSPAVSPEVGHLVDSASYLGKLREATGFMFDLPTHAQWEYACRAGTSYALGNETFAYAGKEISRTKAMMDYGWFASNSTNEESGVIETHPVGLKRPNAWGLYDMLGNVMCLCLDWYMSPMPSEHQVDPMGGPIRSSGTYHVCCGAAYSDEIASMRAANYVAGSTGAHYSYYGLRVVCPVAGSVK